MISCGNCKKYINDTAKYCEHCGSKIEFGNIENPLSTSIAVVEILFGESRSKNYELVLKIIVNTSNYKQFIEAKQKFHSITLKATEIELICRIWNLVGSWKSSSFFINNAPGTLRELLNHGCSCYRKLLKSRNQTDHCFGTTLTDKNIWGCKALEMPESGIVGRWYRNGEFGPDGKWHFDKKAIADLLEQGMHKNRFCPALNRKQIIEAFKKTPDTADPDEEMCFWWESDRENTSKGLTERKTGVAPNYKNYQL